MPALPLTQEQLQDAARLKDRFLSWQKRQREAGLQSSQEVASEQLGFNQSSLSQYLNGNIPLNIDAATKFADLIGCHIADFSPALASQAARYATTLQGGEPTTLGNAEKSATVAPGQSSEEAGPERDRLRAVEAPQASKLQWVTDREAELLSEFRACAEPQRERLLVVARGLPKAAAAAVIREKA